MSALGKQVGPLPLGGWILVVGAGLAISYYTSGGHPLGGLSGTTANTQPSTLDTSGTGANGEWVDVNPPGTAANVLAKNNREWGQEAVNHLIAAGYDPALAESTIAHALKSGKLSVREWALWAVVLGDIGAPPTAVHPTENKPTHHKPPKTPPTPPTKPPKGHVRIFTVQHNGTTLHELAQRLQGPGTTVHGIFNANRVGVRRANGTPGILQSPNQKLHKGQHLVIP